jgi:two-component system sensor histidine kinase KdpD
MTEMSMSSRGIATITREASAGLRKEAVKESRQAVKMSLNPDPRTGAARGAPALGALSASRRRALVGIFVAVAAPAAVTLVASVPADPGTTIPALLYLLAVVGAAAVGHLWPGLLAAVVSFVEFDYFFTAPQYTFRVSKAEDLFALAVFLVVAAVVSAALSAALEQRSTAEFREQQVRALYHVTDRLLSGAGLETVLRDLAGSLRSLYGLQGCRVVVLGPDGTEGDAATSGVVGGENTVALPLMVESRPVGRIEMTGPPAGGIGGPEGAVLDAFAGQLALALERARLGREATEAKLDAEASRIRAALFSSVTHDLRTPLASITASASSLLEEGVPFSEEQRRELLRTIMEESERLNRLVANLMDLSRLRAGALVPTVEPVPLEDVISSVVQRLKATLGGHTVRVRMRDDVPDVPVDVVQMDQVMTNLLENAVRYSPPGSEIGVSAVRWQDLLEVRVADRGPGIPAAERQHVFEEFYRKDVGGQRGGTGLGLAIAKAIVQAHAGSIWIEDTPGGGTTVGFRLPLARGPAARPAGAAP